MGIFDKIKETAINAANSTQEFANKTSEKMKLNKELKEIEGSVEKALLEIGKKYVEENKGNAGAAYAELVESVISGQAAAEAKKTEIAFLEGNVVCKACGAAIKADAQFCDKCGAKNEKPVAAEPVANVCANCGAAMDADAVFCASCGASKAEDTAKAEAEAAIAAEESNNQ